MEYIFNECKNLNNLDLFLFNTENVNNMKGMFCSCNNLELSSFDTKNVIDMSYMFYEYGNLNSLDLSSFDTQKVNCVDSIFYGCQENVIDSNKSKFEKFNIRDMTKEYIPKE